MGPLLNWVSFLVTGVLILGSGHLLIKRIKNKKLENIIVAIVWLLFLLALGLQVKYKELIIEYFIK